MIKRKGDKLYVKWKGYLIVLLIEGLNWISVIPSIAVLLYKNGSVFSKPYEPFDPSSFALKSSFAVLKTKVDEYRLVPVPVDLSKLSDLVRNDAFKKTVYNKLVTKVNSTDTITFVLKTRIRKENSWYEWSC